jgi:nucleotide-binding universal stress UspA family protein
VPTDFSECSLSALEYGAELARALGARLILLHVAEPAVYAENLLTVSPASEDVNQSLLKKSRERLEAIGRDKITHCAPEQILVRLGHAHSEITDSAEALGADLIVLGTHGNTPLKHGFLGSTSECVVRQASCPVITVPEKWAIAAERR